MSQCLGCGADAEGLYCSGCLADPDRRPLRRSGSPGNAKSGTVRDNVAPAAASPLQLRSEDVVQREIVRWLKQEGWDVTVTSAHTHPKGITPGTPDLYLRRGQQRLWVEVKKPDGVVSEAQVRWHTAERAAGGTVLVAYGLQDLSALAQAGGVISFG